MGPKYLLYVWDCSGSLVAASCPSIVNLDFRYRKKTKNPKALKTLEASLTIQIFRLRHGAAYLSEI